MKMLMYGAGSIGRGFIGPLFAQAGYEVVFVDVDRRLVDGLNRYGGYCLHIAAEPPYKIRVEGVRAVDGNDEQAVLAEMVSCDCMATALGAEVLKRVSPLLARGLLARRRAGAAPLDILICENLKDASVRLREWLEDALPENERGVLRSCGLVETAIGRMVPVAGTGVQEAHFLDVLVEEYDFLPVDAAAFVGDIPPVERIVPYTPFAFYEERKLYMHNMGHAVCAYLGLSYGYTYIYEAIADPYLRLLVQGAMTEAAAMLSCRHGKPFSELFVHAEDLLYRFGNRALGDTCARVARDPARKLAADDRLAGPLRGCWEKGIYPVYIAAGLAAALLRLTDNVRQATETLHTLCGLNREQAETVLAFYTVLAHGSTLPELWYAVQAQRLRLYGKCV